MRPTNKSQTAMTPTKLALADDFERLRATTAAERTELLRLIDKSLNDGNARRAR